jgi:hypothetical protein
LQKRRSFLLVELTPHSLPPLPTRTSFARDLEPGLSSIDPAPAVGKHSPLLALAARAKRYGQQHFLT